MTGFTNSPRYTRVAAWLHWIIGLLLIGNIAGGLLHDYFDAATKEIVMGLHFSTGILILALSIVRLLWRVMHRPPPLPAAVPGWQKWGARLSHAFLYALMFALPVTGWLMMSAGPYPFDFYGLFQVPMLPVEPSKALGKAMNERHELLGYIAIALIILHIGAALKHHYLDRDGVSGRINPLGS
jgi:cytochrome b561